MTDKERMMEILRKDVEKWQKEYRESDSLTEKIILLQKINTNVELLLRYKAL